MEKNQLEKQRVLILTTNEIMVLVQCMAETEVKSAPFETAKLSAMIKIKECLAGFFTKSEQLGY